MPVEDQLKYFYDAWGSDKTYNHMAVPWTWAFNTPFSWTKQVASHFGGTRQRAWRSPGRSVIKDKGGIRNQFHHVIDVVPTILEAAGIQAAGGGRRHRAEARSRASAWPTPSTRRMPPRLRRHRTQYFEMMGDHAIYHDGWIASTKVMRPPWEIQGGLGADPTKYPWELYDLATTGRRRRTSRPSIPTRSRRCRPCSGRRPSKYQVLPLDATVATRLVAPRPSITAGRNIFTWTAPLTGTPNGDAPSVLNASYTFTAEIDVPQGGGDGMLITQGGRFAGYGFYL